MPNLVGIGNSQVPTNAMLGGLAYQDSIGEITIDKIKARTSDTALNIFVYDTRKDSDGGAWRKRATTQSWYNEVVGAERGARREFPSVAVIVVASTVITIYDGDNPNLPMWMVLKEGGSSRMLYSSSGSDFSGAVSALNGNIYYGMTGNGTLGIIEFVRDSAFKHRNNNRTNRGRWRGTIADRNLGLGWDTENDIRLAGEAVSDIATTVLPNAPIETSTGLPIPTIAAVTDGGTSIIKDDGTIVDITATGYTPTDDKIDFDHLNNLIFIENAGFPQRQPIPAADTSRQTAGTGRDRVYGGTSSSVPAILGTATNIVPDSHGFVCGSTTGLTILDYDTSQSQEMVAYAAASYNTGYMHGDIKGAFLSDTDTTNITSGEILSNGDFTNGTTGWTLQNASEGSISVSNNQLTLNNTNSSDPPVACYQQISLEVGQYYNVTSVHASGNVSVVNITTGTSNNGGTGGIGNVIYHNATGSTRSVTFLATHATMYCYIRVNTNGTGTTVINSISIRKAEEDRSVNGVFARDNVSALTINGTINKNPVATGAELVAYSNFSSGRYLFQPYKSDLDFTTTMSIMFWVKDWVGSDSLLHRGPGTTRNSKTSFHLYCSYDYNYRITFTTNGSTEQSFEFNHTVNLSGWQCVCFTLSGGTVRGFRNGIEQTLNQTSFSGNIFSQATDKNGLWIGTGPVGGAAETASLALLRLSASAPSAEQVKKIYNDEKCLFHETAKCTLHGTSDAVTGLAFDDTNGVLHVGTSAGRSEFQGLNRINNTTTAVTTAISASNEFVAEQ